MKNVELKKIIENHEKWLKDQEGGKRADLYSANLCGANLHNVNLNRAILRSANLHGANLSNANLNGADLCYANLYGANLRNANLHGANLCGANLCGAYLCDANLCNTDWRYANLQIVELHGAKNVPYIPITCPESGSFSAWKKAHGYIVKLLIPEDARRSSAVGRKCRCDKAIVVAIETLNGKSTKLNEIASDYDSSFIYRIGETVVEPDFCEDRFKECAEGIHFFVNRQEAVDYGNYRN